MDALLVELAVTMNGEAARHANALIRAGKIKDSGSWSGPEASAENRYIDDAGWGRYGSWFLGRQSDAEPETKAHYRYPFSDDFERISVPGLKAIRSRAAQNNETDIFDAAGRMLEAIDKKMSRPTSGTITLGQFNPVSQHRVNADTGEMFDINILSLGEAKGHSMLISPRTLKDAMSLLSGVSLPAYLSHSNALGDRLLSEIGIFSGFYLDGDHVKARNFRALGAFKKFEPEQYERLFEMASTAPDLFGVSIVFEARLFWETDDGAEEEFSIMAERPANALYEMPSVQPLTITSADFVDSPAANPSLFHEQGVDTQPEDEIMKTETTELSSESASAKMEAAKAASPEAAPAPVEDKADDKPKKKVSRKKAELAVEPDAMPLEVTDDVAPELDASVVEEAAEAEPLPTEEEISEELGDDKEEILARLAAAEARVEELEKLHAPRTPALTEMNEAEQLKPAEEMKQLIDAHVEANPHDNRSTAVLAIAKTHPQLFTTNN